MMTPGDLAALMLIVPLIMMLFVLWGVRGSATLFRYAENVRLKSAGIARAISYRELFGQRQWLRREVREAKRIPRGYGAAYYDYVRRMNICYPVPLNLIVRFFWHLWPFLAHPSTSRREEELSGAYWRGHKDGRKAGEERGHRRAMRERLADVLKIELTGD